MTGIIDSNKLVELVLEKHKKFLEVFKSEFSEIDMKLNSLKQQSDSTRKEMEIIESKIAVLTEKYHLLFHQAKKQREDIFIQAIDKMQAGNIQDTMRMENKITELEKKLQISKNIQDEERIIDEIKGLLNAFESAAKERGIIITCSGVTDRLNEANSSHRELLSLQDKPKEHTASASEYNKQITEFEGRHNWLKHRIESHSNALAYWEKQKEGIKVD